MIPEKLKPGDEIRIVAPSRSFTLLPEGPVEIAKKRLTNLGFKVTFGKNIKERDDFISSSVESRVSDLHDAFSDSNVKGILTSIGGFNVNQILSSLDYDLIRNNPKILCGYSDITALQNAIYARTGLITYSGPHFSTFGMLKGFDYTFEYFKKCLFSKEPFTILPSSEWSDDPSWYVNQENRTFHKNPGYTILQEGTAHGNIIGGNLCTLQLLHGTKYTPNVDSDIILFLEDCYEGGDCFSLNFDRDLQSVMHQPYFKHVKGLVIGRFEHATELDVEKLRNIVLSKKELGDIPVIAGADFGHTFPMITFPVGGTCSLEAYENNVKVNIKKH